MTDFEKWLEILPKYGLEYTWDKTKYTKRIFLPAQSMLEVQEYRLSCDFHYMPDENRSVSHVMENERKEVERIYSLFSDHMSRLKLRLMIELLSKELEEWENSICPNTIVQ